MFLGHWINLCLISSLTTFTWLEAFLPILYFEFYIICKYAEESDFITNEILWKLAGLEK